MRRLWVRWALLVAFVAVLGSVFVNLGEWQLHRLAARQERNADTVANERNAVVGFEQVFDHPIVERDQWQRVEARGVFDAEHQFVLRYRSNGDANGIEVVTPLRTDHGTVLVDRGFLELARGEAVPALADVPPPPTGEVTVMGHVRRSEVGRRSATTPVDGQMRLLNSAAVAATLPYPVVDGYLGLLSVDPPQSGDFRPVPLPEISEGPHFWYAVQWFMFTAFAVAGVFVFIRGDVRARRAERAKQASSAATAQPKVPAVN